MLRVMSGGWLASSSGTSGPSMQQHQRQMSQPGDGFADSNEPPSFPMPGSVQRIGGQRNTENYDDSPSFHFSPPSPSSSVTNSSGASTPPTPRALNSRPKPSHRPFSPEPDTLTLALPPSTTTKPIRKSKKMALKPGHSYLDWARLCKEGGDEMRAGFDRPQRMTMSEVAEHRTREDAWSVFNGKVYNITPYLHFHPGGVGELMRAAGRDGTELFMRTHGWVNADLMMESCLIGFLVRE